MNREDQLDMEACVARAIQNHLPTLIRRTVRAELLLSGIVTYWKLPPQSDDGQDLEPECPALEVATMFANARGDGGFGPGTLKHLHALLNFLMRNAKRRAMPKEPNFATTQNHLDEKPEAAE